MHASPSPRFDTIISAGALAALRHGHPRDVLILDCSFELAAPHAGRRAYDRAHLPGAHFVDVEHVLSKKGRPDQGRHPLPDAGTLAGQLENLGAADDMQIVVYDRSAGMFAARAWWLLRWLGHRAVAVLDGGFDAWQAAGLPTTTGMASPPARGTLSQRPGDMPTIERTELLTHVRAGTAIVLDARSPDRFRGENETIDPVAGHIPGARSRYFQDNLDARGHFKPAEQLAEELGALLDGSRPVVSQCGSGITACHNILALEIAGLPGAALYPGSWSEWCAHPDLPVAVGT